MKIQLSTFLATSSALAVATTTGGDRTGREIGGRGVVRGRGGVLLRGRTGRKSTGGRTGRKSTRCIEAAPKAPRDANEMDMESPQNAIQVKVLPPSGGKRIYEQLDEVDDCVHQALTNMAKYD